MDKQAVEAQLCQLPISQYAWIDPQTIEFSDRIRYVCEHECPMYGTSWACPPAVGTVAACRERILSYPGALVFTTLCEVDDIADLSAALATRAPHEAVTRQVRDILRQFSPDVLTLSTESCAICEHCAYPDAPCRHPDKMFPCVESHGIVVTALAEKYGKTPAQICLRWVLQHGLRPIPKSVTPSRMAENLDIYDFHIEEADMAAIDALENCGGSCHDPDTIELY